MLTRAANLTHLADVERLSKHVIRILGQNASPMTLQGTNSYIVGAGENRLLIDTSSPDHSDYLSKLEDVLKSERIKIESILLTHHHYDHVGMVGDIIGRLSHYLVPNCKVMKLRSSRVDESYSFNLVDLEPSKKISIPGASLRVFATPGHCPDHVSFSLDEEDGAIFIGDSVLGEGSTTFDNLSEYMHSLQMMANMKPPRLYPGHGPVVENGTEKILEYIAHRHQREKQIVHVLFQNSSKALSVREIVAAIYPDLIDEILIYKAGDNVLLHLEKLKKDGAVSSFDDNDTQTWKLTN